MNTTKMFIQSNPNVELTFQQIVEFTLNKQEGGIIEIGVGHGDTSVELLKLCEKHNREYIAIDPFESNWNNIPESYGKPYPYEVWSNNIKPFRNKNRITHYQVPSQDKSLYKILKQHTPIAFAFVDGLQFKEAVLSDIKLLTTLKCAVICIDDYNRNTTVSQVPEAVNEFLQNNPEYKVVAENNNVTRCKAYIVDNTW